MKARKSSSRVVGVYPHSSGYFRVLYMLHGVSKTEYRKTEAAAQARAEELKELLSQPNPDLGTKTEITGDGLSRADWVAALWSQVSDLAQITDPALKCQATTVMAQCYKVVRDDIEAIERGKAAQSAESPENLSTEELKKRISNIVELKAVKNASKQK